MLLYHIYIVKSTRLQKIFYFTYLNILFKIKLIIFLEKLWILIKKYVIMVVGIL